MHFLIRQVHQEGKNDYHLKYDFIETFFVFIYIHIFIFQQNLYNQFYWRLSKMEKSRILMFLIETIMLLQP